jgi:hypothetical protein
MQRICVAAAESHCPFRRRPQVDALVAEQRALCACAGTLSVAVASADALLQLGRALRHRRARGAAGATTSCASPLPEEGSGSSGRDEQLTSVCQQVQQLLRLQPVTLCWALPDALQLHDSLAAGDLSTQGLRATINVVVKSAACLLP